MSWVTSSEVEYPRIISTSFMTGTGFMKCMPITLSGRVVTAAILVIEMEEVLVARMTSDCVSASKSLKILSLRSTFSVAASTTNSTPFTPSAMLANVVRFCKVCAFCASVRPPLATWRSRFLPIVATARSSAASDTSMRLTWYPNCAKTCAMPLPIVPAPITATFFI